MQAHIKILIAIKAASDVVILILKHANKSRMGAIDWGPNDYDVFESERCVGRIFLSPAAPSDRNWMCLLRVSIRLRSTIADTQ